MCHSIQVESNGTVEGVQQGPDMQGTAESMWTAQREDHGKSTEWGYQKGCGDRLGTMAARAEAARLFASRALCPSGLVHVILCNEGSMGLRGN